MQPELRPIVTMTMNDRIRRAECSACGEPLGLGDEVGSPEEQRLKVQVAFDRHVSLRHRHEDAVASKSV